MDMNSSSDAENTCTDNHFVNTKLVSPDKKQYIKKNLNVDARIKYSGKVYYENSWMKIHSDGILSTFNIYHFIALVQLRDQEELDFTKPFEEVKTNLIEKLEITEILKDYMIVNREREFKEFKKYLFIIKENSTKNLQWADDLFQVSNIFKKYRSAKKSHEEIFKNIITNKHITLNFKTILTNLLDYKKHVFDRNKSVHVFRKNKPINLIDCIQNFYKEGIEKHRNILLDKFRNFNPKLISNLKSLPKEYIPCVQITDIELFVELYNMSNNTFSNFIDSLQDDFFKKIKQTKNVVSLTNSMYYFLYKSYQELIIDISKKENTNLCDLIPVEQNSLKLPDNKLLLNTFPDCYLRKQCDVIYKLMKHFQPGYYSVEQKFKFKFNLLEHLNDETWWQHVKNLAGINNSIDSKKLKIPEERLVWLYIFDHVISQYFDKKQFMSLKSLVDVYLNIIQCSETDSHESFRVITHNFISFIIQTNKDYSLAKLDFKNFPFAKFFIYILKRKNFILNDFRDFLDVSNEYFKMKNDILKFPDKFSCNEFKSVMKDIYEKLLTLLEFEISDTFELQILFNYFKSLNEFLNDLNAVQFDWFIKVNSDVELYSYLIREKIIGVVENKLSIEEHKTYLVLNEEKFVKILNAFEKVVPQHYIIDIINIFLSILNESLLKISWNDNTLFNPVERLNATNNFLSAIRSSFLYFKEQPDYVSFDVFKKESTEPFISALRTSKSYQEFVKRINIIKDSFWYLRKQDEIDVKEALNLYQQINDAVNIDILEKHYKNYLEKFNNYIFETFDKNHKDKIKFIVDVVQSQRKSLNFHEWDSEFKSEFVPTLLAGLAAVWAIKKSKDIKTTGKLLKPHCVQILCILRLLSVDREIKGVEKHLIEVLTGQGKSLVLGLLSSLLAMTDHRVQIVCYSDYLANRDKDDFCEFFKEFGIAKKIQYCTFDEIASTCININGRLNLRNLVENQIFNRNTKSIPQKIQNCVDNTILLIDEVDVFFSDKYYGSTSILVSIIKMLALVNIQEKIWEIVQNNLERKSIKNQIENYINEEINNGNESFLEFYQFRSDPHRYFLLDNNGNKIIKREYSNQTLWEDHLDQMIEEAIFVVQSENSDYFLNSCKIIDDIIHMKDKNLIYRKNYFSSEKIFCYFKLKQRSFDHKNYENYGYLVINCGKISYAKLPEKYPLILGVSGTLSTLNDYEKKVIKEHYNIDYISNMPSFFGYSHLIFDPNKNFICCDSEEKWLDQIYHHANSMIDLGRSVLIFFDTDKDITKFQKNFHSKFNRLNILTGNSECQDVLIDQAGITKTLTLVTREMGRGVDFKSSVTVEKHGGIHVIQTFFSLDVKEETQIKGRTARKDNKGSYEIIVCKGHLIKASLLDKVKSTVNYQSLNESRTIKMEEYGEKISKKLKNSEQEHQETMNYIQHLLQL